MVRTCFLVVLHVWLAVIVKAAPIRKEQPLFVAKITKQNTIQDSIGRRYDLNAVQPDATIFDPKFYFYDSPHSTEVISYATGKRIPVAVYRGNYKGVLILMGKDENGAITLLQLRPPGEDPLLFYGNTSTDDNSLIGVRSSDFDYSGAALEHGDAIEVLEATSYQEEIFQPEVPRRKRTRTRSSSRRRTQTFVYERGDGDSDECTVFKIISMAIAYDAEFCQLHRGNEIAAAIAIQIIVAGGSEYYENDLCTKVQLTSVVPDITCSPSSSHYTSFTKTSCGGSPGYLREFSTFMATNRQSFGIDPNSLVHLFTGATPPGNVRGCAWRPGLCSLDFSYGVLFQSANHPNPVAQALLFAHELGHNLDATHDLLTEGGLPNYIMEPIENDGSDGFSQASIDSMLALIDSDFITCDSEEVVPTPGPRVTPAPSAMPSKSPSAHPIGTGVPTKTNGPSIKPSVSKLPSDSPSVNPSTQPSPSPTINPTTSVPIAAPTTAKPSKQPTSQPTFPAGCDFVTQSFCVPASGLNNDYACIPKTALIELASACDNAFFLELTGCFAEVRGGSVADAASLSMAADHPNSTETSLGNKKRRIAVRGDRTTSSRGLRKRRKRDKKRKHEDDDDDDGGKSRKAGKSGKSKVGDDDDDDDDNDTPSTSPLSGPTPSPVTPVSKPTLSPVAPVAQPISSPVTPAPFAGNSDRSVRFEARDCTSTCIDVQEFVCFNALSARVISTFYDVFDTSGAKAQQLRSLVAVLPLNTDGCVLPAATCVETSSDLSVTAEGRLESPEMVESLISASNGVGR